MKLSRALVVLGLLASLAVPAVARARSASEFAYVPDRVWNASIRLVRVDLGCPVGERDAELGFFLFEYREGSRTVPGSVEIVPTRVEGREGARVVVQIPAMPSYVERMILERLRRKLVDDFGEPQPLPRERPAPTPPETEPDAPESPPTDAPPSAPRSASVGRRRGTAVVAGIALFALQPE